MNYDNENDLCSFIWDQVKLESLGLFYDVPAIMDYCVFHAFQGTVTKKIIWFI